MLTLAIFIFMLSVVISPDIPIQGAKSAVDVCLANVIPSLFPVFVLNHILIKSGAITNFCNRYLKKISFIFNLPPASAAAIIMGIISGYPVGVKTAGDLYHNKELNFSQYKHLVAFCGNAGPVFITGTVGAKMFHSSSSGILLLAVHIFSAITVGIIFRFLLKNKSCENFSPVPVTSPKSFVQTFTEGVETSVKTTAMVCGYIIFFGMVTAYLQNLLFFLPQFAAALLTGFIEMTNGTLEISASCLPVKIKLAAVSGIIGWGGLCVHAQSLTFLKHKKTYFAGKALQGVISCIITYLIL